MKLYPKLVLTIFFLILLQSLMTTVVVSTTVRNDSLRDARFMLSRKAVFIANNYHSWKRHLWKQLIRIREESVRNHELDDEKIEDLLQTSRIDGVLVRNSKTEHFLAVNPSEDFVAPPPGELKILYNHPAIHLFRLQGRLYLVGGMTLPLEKGYEIYLIKHISGSFLKNIVLDADGRALIHTSTDYLAGNLELQPFAFSEGREENTKAYAQWHDLQNDEGSWNMARAKIGWIDNERGPSDVYITTIISNEAYRERIRSIETTLLSVSLVTLFLTILLSLVLTRSITRPVALLARAMDQISAGEYHIRLKQKTKGELGIMLQGFNDMASRLHQDQLKIEKSLEEITFLNEFNEEIIHTIRDALAVIDGNLEIEKHNYAFHLLNRTRTLDLGIFLEDSFEAPLLPVVQAVLKGECDSWSQRVRSRRGRIFELSIYPLHRDRQQMMCLLLFEDISDKNAYEERIMQAEKLSSISMLSAGIAHEVNNPLSSIMTNIQNLIAEETDGEKREYMTLIEDESLRIAQIIRDLMNFTDRDQNRIINCSLPATADEVCRLIRHSRRPDGSAIPSIRIEADPGIPPVHINRGELMQIFLNLLQNAVHATPGDEAIIIEIEADKQNVRTRVRDRGCGIPEERQGSVFDPFFTTKINGEGTGLGLSVVYGIIMKYRGGITIDSGEGKGTVVEFTLPVEKGGREL